MDDGLGPARIDGAATDPLIKWVGGKRPLVPLLTAAVREIRALHPAMAHYAEPFVGAGGSLLGLRASGVLDGLGCMAIDANHRVMNLHRWTARDPGKLDTALEAMPHAATKATYYPTRDTFNTHAPMGVLQAARLVWLNRTGFNGLYRENQDGACNVSLGVHRVAKVPSTAWIHAVSRAWSGVTLQTSDYHDLRLAQRGIIYCDPPYLGGFTDYTAGGFNSFAHLALARRARTWTRQGHVVLLSNADTPETHTVYAEQDGWRVIARPHVQRTVGGQAERNERAPEVLLVLGLSPGDARDVRNTLEAL